MAVSKWFNRKTFEEASRRADTIKATQKIKREKNSGLFTQAQESLRVELGLGRVAKKGETDTCTCVSRTGVRIRPSRFRPRIRSLKRK